jgi:hypothetical protein
VVAFQSWNFGQTFGELDASSLSKFSTEEEKQIDKIKDYYYEFFIERAGNASFTGPGGSIKKKASDASDSGMAYRIYGCGIKLLKNSTQPLVVSLESIVVLPKT